MKLKAYLPICFLAALTLTGCSSDDDSTSGSQNNTTDYFPLALNNSWNYNNQRTIEGQSPSQSQETLSIVDSSEENGNTFYNLDSNNDLEGGLATTLFSNGNLSKVDGALIYSGGYALDLPNIGDFGPLEIQIDNAMIFDSNAVAGTELFSFSDSIEQDIEVQPGVVLPIAFNYSIATNNVAFLPTYMVGDIEYSDILEANVILTASVTTSLGPISGIPILAEQEVLHITNYYANGIGLISSEVEINYVFEDLSNFGLPSIPSVHVSSTQSIDSYIVNP